MFGMADQDAAPPAGFEPLFRSSPFSEAVGPSFYRKAPSGSFVGWRARAAKHANARGGAHGGFLMTLVDIALGYRAAFSEQPPAALITASCAQISSGPPKSATGSKPTSMSTRSAHASPSRTLF
jgi:acyl-coenzyme A thioesterase PaaI-like protein